MIYFIVPVYNEERNVARLLNDLSAACEKLSEPFRAVVVNDGSTDGSIREIERHPERDRIELLNFERNRGIGRVIVEGFSHACELAADNDQLVFIEADCSNDLATLAPMLGLFRRGADVVAASRYMPGGGFRRFPPARRAASWCANFLLRFLVPLPNSSDYTYFFKMYRARTVKRAFEHYSDRLIRCRGFAANSEFFIKMRRLTANYAQAPAFYDYSMKLSKSKFSVAKEARELLGLIRNCRAEPRKRPLPTADSNFDQQ